MDVQLALLSKVILYGELRSVINARITGEFFTDDRYKRVFSYLTRHWQDYGIAPDAAVMKTAFPNMEWEDDPQPIEYFIDQLRRRRKKSILTEGLNVTAQHLRSDDPDSVEQMEFAIQEALIQARTETSSSLDEDLTASRSRLQALLDLREDDPGYLRGISTGFDGIDYVTGGLQPEQYVVLIGTIKSFKSATLLKMAVNVHRHAKVPLYIGFEMSNTEQEDRTLSLISGVSLTKIMNGNLTVKERRKIEDALRDLEGMRPFIFSSDITSATTVSGVQAKMQEYVPDVVFIDGAYMMQSELGNVEPGSPQALTSISRGLKRLSQSSKTPIVITTQASLVRSKGGLTGGSAMYTQAWGQDCDVLLGVERIGERKEDETAHDPVQVKFKVIESRSGPRKSIVLEWDWHNGSCVELDAAAMTAALDKRTNPGLATEDGSEWES